MTTPVGSIKLDLSIDGSGLPADVLREIGEALGPTLAKINRDLDALQRKLDQTARTAEKSGAKQAAANKMVAESVEDIGDEYSQSARAAEKSSAVLTAVNRRIAESVSDIGDAHTKAAATAVAGSRVQVSSLRAVTREIDQQAAAWARLGAARTAAASTPTPGGPGGGGGGSGGGGGGRSGNVKWHGGRGGFLGSPLGLNAIALGVGSFPAAATAVTNLTGALQQLVQVGGALPGVIAGGVTAVGTAALGFHGMADAVKALNEAAASGDPKDLEKVAEALKDMDPAAVAVAKSVSKFTQGPLKDLRKQTAGKMFAGIDAEIDQLANKTMPTLTRGTAQVGSAWNKTFKELGRVGGLDSTQSFLDKIFGNTAEAQTRANAVIDPLVHGLGTLTSESSDFLPRLADGLTAVTTRFDNWITKSAANGNLDKWINEGIDAATSFGNTLINVGKIITSITKAAGGDGGLLEALENGSTALSNFLSSDEGQAKLTAFFREGREQLAQWLPILQNLGSIAGNVYQGMKDWSAVLLPALQSITGALASLPGGISGVVTAFLAWKTISGVSSLLTSITGLGNGIDALPARADKAAGGISKALSRIALPAGLAFLGFNDMGENGVNLGNALTTVGGATVAGASMGGPVGALIGAITGLTAVLIKMNPDQFESDNDEKDWQRWRDSGGSQRVETANEITGRNGVLMPSFYNPDGTLRPSVGQDMTAKIAAGSLPGLTLGPNGTVLQNGVPIPGLTLPPAPVQGPPVPAAAAPTAPDRPLPVQIVNPLPGTQTPTTPPVEAPSDLASLLGGAQLPEVKANVAEVAKEVQQLPEGVVKIKDPSPEVLENLKKLDAQIENTGKDEITVKANTSTAQATIDAFVRKYQQQQFKLQFNATVTAAPAIPAVPHGADGMVIPGYAPGLDIVNAVLAPGEGVLIPEAVRGLGGPAGVYALNSRFRSGLSKRYYADGGVHAGTGALPGPGDDATELGVLRQIRDLLAGKGGTSAPLNQTASAVSSIADKNKTGGQELGPFGTPIKPRHRGYEMAAAAISALGGDPEKWLGADPATLPVTQGGLLPVLAGAGGIGGGTANVAALQKFAQTGNIADLAGTGLDVNDSVVQAIVTARNKKKGALGADAISDLIGQTFGPGGYTGSVTSSNSALLSALQSYQEKLAKGAGSASSRGGYASVAALTGVPMTGLPGAGPKGSKAGLQPNAAQLWDVIAAQFPEVREIGGVRNDPIPDHPSGRALDIMVGQNQELGDRINEYLRANATALGLDSTIWRDKWADFAGNTSTVGGHQDHIHAKVAEGAATGLAGLQIPGTAPFQAGLSGGGGTPVFVTNWPGGQGVPGLGGIVGAGLSAGGGVAGTVTGDVMSAVAGLGQEPWNKAANYASLNQLVRERNPLALAKAFGLDVPDFTRQGGDGADVMKNDQAFDSSGRLFSDTGALLDRTFTNLNAQLAAMREQLVSVIEQTNQKLNEEALEPVVKAGVQNALEGLKDSVSGAIGTALGQAAAPPIADAVRSAMPAQNGTSLPADAANGFKAATGMATGGGVFGGVPGRDSVPAMLMPGEHVLTTTDVARMGGHGGVYAFRAALARNGGMRGYATGGGVNVNDTVGAEFFGVSQIPIIGAIVNILVRVLLSVLGVQIEARDTLGEMTDQFRQFRGEFKAFDASGRLLNDTSALMDRSQSSEEIAAQERIRILKIVIQALIKYIIEKVIVPMAKAVANAAIQAGSTAASSAINSQAPGAGNIVGALISSAGSAGVDIAAEVGTDLALAISEVAVQAIAEGLQSIFPDLMTGIFGGGVLEQLLGAPISAALEIPLAMIGALTGGLSGLFAPLAAIVGGLSFDEGGVAHGVGLMPKATIRPERVLSPQQTASFDRLVAWLDRNQGSGGPGGQTIVQIGEGAIQVAGGPEAGRNVASGLMELMS
ncbi:hypothetical protein [Mycolicibacterium fortuitum]|uniref:hypothetical protein n=1 Tax=Mycolicibacterium fortuitum TaxID=1766 RepID=UPI00096DEF48|nr:hypothetical protein [Mycolicibacterium fortuitum]OMC08559.1 hypothetical protein A5734_01880 [Mycolicibacterium fortuitum]